MLYGRYISIILLVWIAVLSQLRREKTTAAGGINSATTLLKIQKSATESSVSEPQTENAPSLACDDDTIDMIGHHNERGKKRTKQESTPEPEEDDGDCGEFAEI